MRVLRHVLMLIGLLVALTAVAIWFGLGPVVYSTAAGRAEEERGAQARPHVTLTHSVVVRATN